MMILPGFLSLPGGSEWIILLLIILLILGPKNLPKLGTAMGKFVSGFKAGQRGEDIEDEEDEFEEVPKQKESTAKVK